MSEHTGPIAPANLSTVAAVAAITALLALAYGVYLNRQIQVVAVGATALDVNAARRDVKLEQQISALEKRIVALESKPAADPALTAGAGDGAAAPAAPPTP
jgi:hypothetical protein